LDLSPSESLGLFASEAFDLSPSEPLDLSPSEALEIPTSLEVSPSQPVEVSPSERLDFPSSEPFDIPPYEPFHIDFTESFDLPGPEILELNLTPLEASNVTSEPLEMSSSSNLEPQVTTSEQRDVPLIDHGSKRSQPDLESPLYSGAPVTMYAALLLILAFVLNHNLTNEALADLLSLLNIVLVQPNLVPPSVYKFYKHLRITKANSIRHYYCSSCEKPLDQSSGMKCSNSSCQHIFPREQNIPYFLELPLDQQIQALFQRPYFYHQIQHRFNRTKFSDRHIEDIYDGQLYKEHFKPGGILSSPANLSLLWNTDGVPVFKSSTYSVWPLYFVVNELPYKLRMQKQNILLGGLWFGYSKPNMQHFLRPMWKALSRLELQGTLVQAWGNLQKFVSKIILLAGTCDLPAKCLVQNFIQFNGFMGCSKCLQPGATLTLGPRSHTHIYPYISDNPSGPLRSRKQTAEDVQHYLETGSTRNGVLGPSWFGCLRYFDPIRGTAVDYMHGCLLGVMRRLFHLWLSPENHKKPFYIGQLSSLIDRRLLSIKPPAEISRAPRPLSD